MPRNGSASRGIVADAVSPSRRLLRYVTIAVALAVAASPAAAWAHAHLEGASPADGATIAAAPDEIRLTFSEGVEPGLSGVTVEAGGGAKVATGQARAEGRTHEVLVVPLGMRLDAGGYAVRWHAVSVDGHRTRGTFSFTVRP